MISRDHLHGFRPVRKCQCHQRTDDHSAGPVNDCPVDVSCRWLRGLRESAYLRCLDTSRLRCLKLSRKPATKGKKADADQGRRTHHRVPKASCPESFAQAILQKPHHVRSPACRDKPTGQPTIAPVTVATKTFVTRRGSGMGRTFLLRSLDVG